MKKEDIQKGIANLVKVINRQKEEIAELKLELAEYQSQDVCESWKKLNVTEQEAKAVIGMFIRHTNFARENYGNGN